MIGLDVTGMTESEKAESNRKRMVLVDKKSTQNLDMGSKRLQDVIQINLSQRSIDQQEC